MSGIPSQNGSYFQQGVPVANPAPTNNIPVVPQQQQQQYQPQQPPPPQFNQQQQPWFGPQAYQQIQQAAPTMPLTNPNPNIPAAQPAAPAQQQPTQPATSPYETVYQDLARANPGTSPEYFKQYIKDDPRVMASMLNEAMAKINQPAAPAQQQQTNQLPQQPQVQPPTGKIDIPESVKPYLKRNANGAIESIDPAYQQWAAAANHNEIYSKQVAQKFLDDPMALANEPQFQKLIQQQVREQYNTYAQQQRVLDLRESVRTKFQKEVCQVDQSGQPIMSPYNKDAQGQPLPMLTPLGTVFIAQSTRLRDLGMRESQELYDMAMDNARKEMGITPQQMQQYQQQQQPQLPNLWGQQNPQQAMFQPQQQPMFQQPQQPFPQLQQQQQNAWTAWPGQPPARNASIPQDLTFEQALALAIKDAPEGMSMGQYLPLLSA